MTRYARSADLLRLALQLAGAHEGLSLDEIARAFEVSRRTAERMRDALERVFPALEAKTGADGLKRWRLPKPPAGLVQITAEELAEVAQAARSLRRRGLLERARHLDSVGEKLRAIANAGLRRIEPDLDLLLEAEGFAMRPGPRPRLKPGLLSTLREALLSARRVALRYLSPDYEGPRRAVVEPHGLLYGTRPYLVAPRKGRELMQLWRLDRIETIRILNEPFERRADFSLEAYARRAFGVFQEEPFDVVWKFSPAAAADARNWIFHPTQQMEDLPDGSLIVRFRAGGAREMKWHLYTWGDTVEVLEPKGFYSSAP